MQSANYSVNATATTEDILNSIRYATAVVMSHEMRHLTINVTTPEFSNMTETSLSWADYGLSYVPPSLLLTEPSTVEFVFNEVGCRQQDCFGLASLHSLEPRTASLRPRPCQANEYYKPYENKPPVTLNDGSEAEQPDTVNADGIQLNIGYGDTVTACSSSCWSHFTTNDRSTNAPIGNDTGSDSLVAVNMHESPNQRSGRRRRSMMYSSSRITSQSFRPRSRRTRRQAFTSDSSAPSNYPSNIATVWRKSKCYIANGAVRDFCVNPINRLKLPKPGVTDVPPFKWYPDQQRCLVTKAYCNSYGLMTYRQGDCVLTTGQTISELALGSNFTRTLKKVFTSGAGAQESLVAADNERLPKVTPFKSKKRSRRDIVSDAKIHEHLSVKAMEVDLSEPDPSTRGSSTSRPAKSDNLPTYSDTRTPKPRFEDHRYGLQEYGNLNGSGNVDDEALLLSNIYALVIDYGVDFGLYTASRAASKAIQQGTVQLVGKRGQFLAVIQKVTSVVGWGPAVSRFGSRQMLSNVFSKSIKALAKASSLALTAAAWGVDIFLMASHVWDSLDPAYSFVMDQKRLDSVIEHIHKTWSRRLGYSEKSDAAAGKPTIEWTPYAAYHLRFGDFLAKNSPRHKDCLSLFNAATWRYISALPCNSFGDCTTSNHREKSATSSESPAPRLLRKPVEVSTNAGQRSYYKSLLYAFTTGTPLACLVAYSASVLSTVSGEFGDSQNPRSRSPNAPGDNHRATRSEHINIWGVLLVAVVVLVCLLVLCTTVYTRLYV